LLLSVTVAGAGEVEALARQVDRLAEALAVTRAEADMLRARLARYEFGRAGHVTLSPVVAAVGSPVLLDINAGLRMVVLDKGGRDGIRAGEQFAVMKKDEVVAVVRVVDVREKISGAVVLDGGFRAMPDKGDRLVTATGLEN